MPRFRRVEVFPMSGWWDTAWVSGDPDGDAFAKVSRGICDAYSSALSPATMPHTVSSLRIFVGADQLADGGLHDPHQTVVFSPTFTGRVHEGFEQAAVRVGAGFAELGLEDQREVALDAVHAAASGLARFRGMDLTVFDRARASVVAAGYVFTHLGDWKTSPDRRWRARCSFRTLPDGFGRLVVQVESTDGSRAAQTSEQIAWTTAEGFVRTTKTLRWTARDRIEVVPSVGPYGIVGGVFGVQLDATSPGALRLDEVQAPAPPGPAAGRTRSDGQASSDVPAPPRPRAGGPPPPVALVLPDPRAHEIVTVGGGPTNYVPDRWVRTLHGLFGQLLESQWQEWWAASDVPKLEVWWAAQADGPERFSVRRGKDKVIARIERTRTGLRDLDPAQAARDDLAGLMAAVQQRMGLAAPPALR